MIDGVLVAEISGKRPGDKSKRPTERFEVAYPKVIISNDSEGYDTDWPIVNVPEDYKQWYIDNVKSSEKAWYAPMNRSYAIKYAREHGYKYLVQLDDNIELLQIDYRDTQPGGSGKHFYYYSKSDKGLLDDFITMLVTVLENTNAGMAGCSLASYCETKMSLMRERYVYSLFVLKLDICPDIFQGDFEDDIEYRLKCTQMGIPVIQVPCLLYGKTGNVKNGDRRDLTGCRAEYARAGLKRGEHMCKIYGDIYRCRMRGRPNNTGRAKEADGLYFKHFIKPVKVGILVHDLDAITACLMDIIKRHSTDRPDSVLIRQKRIKKRRTT